MSVSKYYFNNKLTNHYRKQTCDTCQESVDLSCAKKSILFSCLYFTVVEMLNKSAAGCQPFPISLSLSPLLIFSLSLPSFPSSHPSIHLCGRRLCGESAVTVCPSSCGPSCLGQMGFISTSFSLIRDVYERAPP